MCCRVLSEGQTAVVPQRDAVNTNVWWLLSGVMVDIIRPEGEDFVAYGAALVIEMRMRF